MAKSTIEWTDATWNPVTGCSKVSSGCKHCYAERLSKRLMLMGVEKYRNAFTVTLHPETLDAPLSWKQPHTIFVNSMSDLFHEDIPIDFINKVFDVISQAHWHRFQVLTKRSQRLRELASVLNWPKNLWMGVSVEMRDFCYRIDDLRATPAQVKFLSLEPLLGPLQTLDLRNIDWVIAGGESGPNARICELKWLVDIRDQCAGRDSFLFQTMGRHKQEKYWASA